MQKNTVNRPSVIARVARAHAHLINMHVFGQCLHWGQFPHVCEKNIANKTQNGLILKCVSCSHTVFILKTIKKHNYLKVWIIRVQKTVWHHLRGHTHTVGRHSAACPRGGPHLEPLSSGNCSCIFCILLLGACVPSLPLQHQSTLIFRCRSPRYTLWFVLFFKKKSITIIVLLKHLQVFWM